MNEPFHRRVLRALAGSREWERRASGVATLVVFPIVFAIFGAYTPDIRKHYGDHVFWAWGILAIIFALLAFRFSPGEPTALSLILENQEQGDEIDALRDMIDQLHSAIDLLSIQSNYSMAMRAAVLQHARNAPTTLEQLAALISEIAEPLYTVGEEIFGFGASEAWSFTVYLYSAEAVVLIPVWREKSRSHPAANLGRIWRPGEGHVGKAFVDQRPLITRDARSGDAAEFSTAPPGRSMDYDGRIYISFASVPIGPILKEDNRPYGVIVGTSDRPDRFDRERAGILVHVASAIAAVLIAGDLNIDNLKAESQDMAKHREAMK